MVWKLVRCRLVMVRVLRFGVVILLLKVLILEKFRLLVMIIRKLGCLFMCGFCLDGRRRWGFCFCFFCRGKGLG